ncbi:hypothetical protein GCM10027614_66530 [Micromonospora vulcania]
MLRLDDQADRAGRYAGLAPDPGGQWHLVAGAERDALLQAHAAGGGVDQVHADSGQLTGEHHAVVQRPTALDPVGRGDPGEHRHVLADRGAYRAGHLQRQSHPAGPVAAVRVGAVVAQRREELVQQVAVRGVDLHGGEPGSQRPFGRGGEAVHDAGDGGRVEGVRDPEAGGERLDARRDRRPATLGVRHPTGSRPRAGTRML